ncbi:MAG: hypothetical protein KBS74_03100 [Clostridiales bacterium]|nr:hypothetical protein [Candidatus Cacconaster stercorequi]
MSEKNRRTVEIVGLFFVLVLGNLLHFVYDWTGQNAVAAAFSAVNESTWEHMKLLAVPWIVWSLMEWAVTRQGSVPFARAMGLLTGLAAIPALFYTYQGVLGRNIDWVNILIFQLAVLLAFAVSRWLKGRERFGGKLWQVAGLVILLAVGAAFAVWTYRPPELAIFTDPITGLPGLPQG